MLADDQEAILQLVAATLEDDPRYEVLLARDGEEALEMARQGVPELLFLDIKMPKLDGYQVCERLKTDPETSHIHVVMLTALSQEVDRERAQQVGADDYFSKPFSPTALLEKLDEVLGAAG